MGVQEQLEEFWESEEIVQVKFLTREEEKCQDNFKETTRRYKEERLVMASSFKDNGLVFGVPILQGLERKFRKKM